MIMYLVWLCVWYDYVFGMIMCLVWLCVWYDYVWYDYVFGMIMYLYDYVLGMIMFGMIMCLVWLCIWYDYVFGMIMYLVWLCVWYDYVFGVIMTSYLTVICILLMIICGTGWLRRYSDFLRPGRSGDRIPVEVRFSALVLNGYDASPAFCTIGSRSFPGVNRPGRGVDHPPTLKKEYRHTSSTRMCLHVRLRGILYLLLWLLFVHSHALFCHFPLSSARPNRKAESYQVLVFLREMFGAVNAGWLSTFLLILSRDLLLHVFSRSACTGNMLWSSRQFPSRSFRILEWRQNIICSSV
jgi:hypothetical protein